jgi:Putative restriction endonuclease
MAQPSAHPKKPLGIKNYGSIAHLPNSRMGEGDHKCPDGQARIATIKVRDKHDRIIVQEKLDGSNVGVALINGVLCSLGRAGYLAADSPYEQHWRFALTDEQFYQLCRSNPELKSPTDSLKETQAKMQEYMASGVKLGWLIHRKTRTVEIYRIGKAVEILDSPATLSGEEILPGFVLELKTVW